MTQTLAGFTHRWIPGTSGRTLVLLHGTGGDEDDLVPLARALAPDANVLSPRGNVLEHGAPRFFRRHSVGVLDLDDLRVRTDELAHFLREAAARYGFDPARVTMLGFSNGANIAASLLLAKPDAAPDAILMRAMLPFEPDAVPALSGRRVLLLAGARDPYADAATVARLATLLREGGARVDVHTSNAGHELAREDLDAAAAWLRAR